MATYAELLSQPEWKHKRLSIVKRDNYECQKCKNSKALEYYDDTHPLKFNVKMDEGCTYFVLPNCFDTNDLNNNTAIAKWEHSNFENMNWFTTNVKIPRSESQIQLFLKENCKVVYYEPLDENHYKIIAIANKITMPLMFAYRCMFRLGEDAIQKNGRKYKDIIDEMKEGLRWWYVAGLHVHHTYYQDGLEPWQYPDEALITYCRWCHEELHKNQKIPHKDVNGVEIGSYFTGEVTGPFGGSPNYSLEESNEPIKYTLKSEQQTVLNEGEIKADKSKLSSNDQLQLKKLDDLVLGINEINTQHDLLVESFSRRSLNKKIDNSQVRLFVAVIVVLLLFLLALYLIA